MELYCNLHYINCHLSLISPSSVRSSPPAVSPPPDLMSFVPLWGSSHIPLGWYLQQMTIIISSLTPSFTSSPCFSRLSLSFRDLSVINGDGFSVSGLTWILHAHCRHKHKQKQLLNKKSHQQCADVTTNSLQRWYRGLFLYAHRFAYFVLVQASLQSQ